jgi:acylphosphatase
VRLRVQYEGWVQGVGFRATTRAIVLRAGGAIGDVTGWVRNEDDGSVTAEFQGDAEAVAAVRGAVRERMGRFIRAERETGVTIVASEKGFVIDR